MDNATNQYHSQMEFLKAYAHSTAQKKQAAVGLKERLESLKPSVEEANKIVEELEDLQKSIRLDEKFLISMNEMVVRNTGEPISNGPLFDASASSASQDARSEKQAVELEN